MDFPRIHGIGINQKSKTSKECDKLAWSSLAQWVTESNQTTQGTPLLLPRRHPQLLVIALRFCGFLIGTSCCYAAFFVGNRLFQIGADLDNLSPVTGPKIAFLICSAAVGLALSLVGQAIGAALARSRREGGAALISWACIIRCGSRRRLDIRRSTSCCAARFYGGRIDPFVRHRSCDEGFVQQLACNLVNHGYWFYAVGTIPPGKNPRAVDEKLIQGYGLELSKWQRARRKANGHAKLGYLRYDRFFILMGVLLGNGESSPRAWADSN